MIRASNRLTVARILPCIGDAVQDRPPVGVCEFPASPLDFPYGHARITFTRHHGGRYLPMPLQQNSANPLPPNGGAAGPCRHPRVQIVAREEDSEFVECLDCREVFESSEFKDMEIEDRAFPEE